MKSKYTKLYKYLDSIWYEYRHVEKAWMIYKLLSKTKPRVTVTTYMWCDRAMDMLIDKIKEQMF